uniref:Integrase core domain containing protein n=1 Tax=Solanum tuberosum TaxID=4113 RepID=M1D8T1_SOLTU
MEGGSIGGVELLNNLLIISPWVSSHPVTLVKVKKSVDVRDSVQAPREDSALLCNKSGHLLFVIFHLGISINFHWPSTHHLFGSPATGVVSSFLGASTDSELVASSDEAACSFWPDPEADLALDPEAWEDSDPEAWADSDPEAWAYSDPEAWLDKEPEAWADSESDVEPAGDPISMFSSLDWETVTTSVTTCRDVFQVARGAVGDVLVAGGTYAGSFYVSVSSSINLKLGATDFDLPCFV